MTRINIVSASLIAAVLSMISFVSVAAGTIDAVSNTTVALPAGNFSTVSLLATGVDGNQMNQKFCRDLYGWDSHERYAESERLAYTSALCAENRRYRRCPIALPERGQRKTGRSTSTAILLRSIALSKTVKSLTLPQNRNVVVLSVDLGSQQSGGGAAVSVNLSNVAKCSGHRQLR